MAIVFRNYTFRVLELMLQTTLLRTGLNCQSEFRWYDLVRIYGEAALTIILILRLIDVGLICPKFIRHTCCNVLPIPDI